MRIVVDAMGGDYAPVEVIKGAVEAALSDGVEIVLVGKQPLIEAELAKHRGWESRISVVHASEVIECSEQPVEGIRNKPDSSIVKGIGLLKNGEASAFVSAGASGAVAGAAMLSLGKLDGVARPALACLFPSVKGSILLIDAGANADCRPPFLVQFAQMGSIFMEKIQGIEKPKVGLLSSGEEDTKGNRLVKETHQLLKATNLNFIGNVEGKDIPKGLADVVVTDGFTGNVVLKTLEGLGEAVQNFKQLWRSVDSAGHVHGTALMSSVEIDTWARKLDFREYGGACLLGVKGNVIKAHGRSRANAIKNAINLASQTIQGNIYASIQKEKIDGQDSSSNG
jgi:glycerol-3-phosphate acyltransferase PlsX